MAGCLILADSITSGESIISMGITIGTTVGLIVGKTVGVGEEGICVGLTETEGVGVSVGVVVGEIRSGEGVGAGGETGVDWIAESVASWAMTKGIGPLVTKVEIIRISVKNACKLERMIFV